MVVLPQRLQRAGRAVMPSRARCNHGATPAAANASPCPRCAERTAAGERVRKLEDPLRADVRRLDRDATNLRSARTSPAR
jgi:hypothetical protein